MAPRALTWKERALLELAVESIADERCRAALHGQLDSLLVVGGLPLYVDLQSSTSVDPTCFPGRNTPIEGTVRSPEGRVIGGINVWIRDGRLSALEAYSFEDVEPTYYPDPTLVRINAPRDIHGR